MYGRGFLNFIIMYALLFGATVAQAAQGKNWIISFSKPKVVEDTEKLLGGIANQVNSKLVGTQMSADPLKSAIANSIGNTVAMLKKNGFQIVHRFQNFHQVIVIRAAQIENKTELKFISELRKNGKQLGIDLIEEDFFFPLSDKKSIATEPEMLSLAITQSNNLRLPWGLNTIEAYSSWQITQGTGARVMILDTGIDQNHPALSGNIEKGKNLLDKPAAQYEYFDEVGHGTHVAGTIVGHLQNDPKLGDIILGVAPESRLLIGRVCAVKIGCSVLSIIKGLDWAISEKVDVVNLSLGSPEDSELLHNAIRAAVNTAGIVVVAASGNNGSDKLLFPAQYPETISVGAVDNELNRASFSQYGPSLNIMAPGVGIFSSIPISNYGGKDGTSMAAPHVSGAVALLKSLDKLVSPMQIKSLLVDSASPISPNLDNQYGMGILNTNAAINKLLMLNNPSKQPKNQ
jgi:subtilisin